MPASLMQRHSEVYLYLDQYSAAQLGERFQPESEDRGGWSPERIASSNDHWSGSSFWLETIGPMEVACVCGGPCSYAFVSLGSGRFVRMV